MKQLKELKIEYIPTDEIKPYKKNARKHSDAQIEKIVKSIKEFGNIDPIGIWKDQIVEGHGRWLAAKRMGMEKVPVIRLDHLTDEQRKAYGLAHNKLTELSTWDTDILAEELKGIEEIDMSVFDFDMKPTEDGEVEIITKELKPYKKVHYLITLDINDNDRIIDHIAAIREMEGIEVESTLN